VDLGTVTSYRTPTTRGELRLAPGERVLGGGTWLFSEPQPGVTGLVDLQGLGWPASEPLPDGGLRIAATCTVSELLGLSWPRPSTAELVRQCVDAFLMSFKVQYAATVGGNLALALPAGAMISLTASLGGEALIWTPDGGERREPVAALVTGASTTTLAPGEIVRAVDLAGSALRAPTAFRRVALSEYGRSGIVVIGRLAAETLVLTVTGATSHPVVLTLPRDAAPAEVRAAFASIEDWYADPHGAADWKAAVATGFGVEIAAELEEPDA
jgi:CO/xanthine dehydrogenase FAD-binding subunit